MGGYLRLAESGCSRKSHPTRYLRCLLSTRFDNLPERGMSGVPNRIVPQLPLEFPVLPRKNVQGGWTIRYRRPDVAPYPLLEKIGEGGMGVATAVRPDVSCFAKPRFFAERMKNRSWKCRGLEIPRANAHPGSNPGSGTILAWP